MLDTMEHSAGQSGGRIRRRAQTLVAAALAIATCSFAGAGASAFAAEPTPQLASNSQLGIDVSAWQPNTDWSKVHADGIRFALIKATQGTTYTNPYYATDRASAKTNGVVTGAYDYAWPRGTTTATASASGAAEAAYFLSRATPVSGDIVPTIDIERRSGLTPALLSAWLQGWVTRVRNALGVEPMIYTSPYFWTTYLADTQVFAQQGVHLWIANWNVTAPTVPAGNWGGQGYAVWQWTDRAVVAGVQGRVDADRSAGRRLTAIRIPTAPKLFARPVIAPHPTNGETTTTTNGIWAGTAPMTFAYQWQRCNAAGAHCVSIPNARASSYPVGPADIWHTLRVWVSATNVAGSAITVSRASSLVPDNVAPAIPQLARPRYAVLARTSFTVAWSATDVGSGIRGYAVRERVAPRTGVFGGWHVQTWNTTATVERFTHAVPGSTSCFSVAAYDRAGNASAWSPPRCTTIPLDDSQLKPAGGWTQTLLAGAFRGSESRTRVEGATLTAPATRAARVGVLAEMCPTCGEITVTFAGQTIATYNLASATTRSSVLLLPPALTTPASGVLVITAHTNNRRLVSIDGVVQLPLT